MHLRLVVMTLALASGCDPEEAPLIPPDAAPDAPNIQGPLVESFAVGTCSTSVVIELSLQIAGEINCMMPGQFVGFQPPGSVQFTTEVIPDLGADARADLVAAMASVPQMPMQ